MLRVFRPSALLSKSEEDGLLSGVKICSSAPSISHLLFADDSLILIQANGEDATQLRNILELYEQCSGQMINKAKSASYSVQIQAILIEGVSRVFWKWRRRQ